LTIHELNESGIWLEMIRRSELLKWEVIQPVMQECSELAKIISSSIRTASGNKKNAK